MDTQANAAKFPKVVDLLSLDTGYVTWDVYEFWSRQDILALKTCGPAPTHLRRDRTALLVR
jgi:hypothetical protein